MGRTHRQVLMCGCDVSPYTTRVYVECAFPEFFSCWHGKCISSPQPRREGRAERPPRSVPPTRPGRKTAPTGMLRHLAFAHERSLTTCYRSPLRVRPHSAMWQDVKLLIGPLVRTIVGNMAPDAMRIQPIANRIISPDQGISEGQHSQRESCVPTEVTDAQRTLRVTTRLPYIVPPYC